MSPLLRLRLIWAMFLWFQVILCSLSLLSWVQKNPSQDLQSLPFWKDQILSSIGGLTLTVCAVIAVWMAYVLPGLSKHSPLKTGSNPVSIFIFRLVLFEVCLMCGLLLAMLYSNPKLALPYALISIFLIAKDVPTAKKFPDLVNLG